MGFVILPKQAEFFVTFVDYRARCFVAQQRVSHQVQLFPIRCANSLATTVNLIKSVPSSYQFDCRITWVLRFKLCSSGLLQVWFTNIPTLKQLRLKHKTVQCRTKTHSGCWFGRAVNVLSAACRSGFHPA